MRSYVNNNNLILNYDSDISSNISFGDDDLRHYFNDKILQSYDTIIVVNAHVCKYLIITSKNIIIKDSEIDDLYIVSPNITFFSSYIKTIYSPPKYNTNISICDTTIKCFIRFGFIKKLRIKDSNINAVYGIYVDELHVGINSTLLTTIIQMNCYVQNVSRGHKYYISRSMNLNNNINILCGDEYINDLNCINNSVRKFLFPYIV